MDLIRLSKSSISLGDIFSVCRALHKGYLGMGEYVIKFENELRTYFPERQVCAVNTGTSALQLVCQAILEPGDEIIVPSITYLANFHAVKACGAIPVACDINEYDVNININEAAKLITDRTKAIMPVHMTGNPGNLMKVYSFARKHNLRVIEDASHAFGSYYNDKKIGCQGDIVVFSLDGIKNLTSGEGGIIVTSDENVYSKVCEYRLLSVPNDTLNRAQGKRTYYFDITQQGWRYHMSNLHASLGLSQLKKISRLNEKRQALAKNYTRHLPENVLYHIDYNNVVPHTFILKLKDQDQRDRLRDLFDKNKIQWGLHYYPNHLHAFFKEDRGQSFLNSMRHFENSISIPLHPDLNIRDQRRVIEVIKSVIN
ncbi:DegT/DnrJ/EryC1/StrS family aminotransferase [Bacteroidia bacterium]|nr:DegT/DnrJ/EryC1/StrS family aminotransferase [Bacteroidia bacterium]